MEEDEKSPSASIKKRKIVDLNELANQAWVHYRNYLDSCSDDNNDGGGDGAEGDIDELQELVDLTTPHVSKLSLHSNPLVEWTSRDKQNKIADNSGGTSTASVSSLLPVLISVAYFHLANSAISDYLHLQQQQQSSLGNGKSCNTTVSDAANETAEKAQNLLNQSLSYYPRNAGTWSVGANFGRMSRRLSLSSVRQWYERAITDATALQNVAIGVLEQPDDDVVPALVKEWIELLYLHQILGIELVGDDDDESDENASEMEEDVDGDDVPMEVSKVDAGDKEINCHKANDGGEYYTYSSVEATARFMCAMLWSTAGRHDIALNHLQHFPALTHRLHPNVWQDGAAGSCAGSINSLDYNHVDSSKLSDSTAATTPCTPMAFQPPNGILPTNLYQRLRKVFAPNAPYWRESDYSNRGYYSYFIEYNRDDRTSEKRRPSNLIEDVIVNYLLPRVEQVLADQRNRNQGEVNSGSGDIGKEISKNEDGSSTSQEICGFEWWVHTRPIQANLGHNLHFDTDEALLSQEGKISHPIASSVLYLTGGGESTTTTSATDVRNSKSKAEPAGSTIVFDQTPDSDQVARTCWKSTPRDNSFMMFPGNMLHGVLPCPGRQETVLHDQDASGARNGDSNNQTSESSIKHVQELLHRWNIEHDVVNTTSLKEDSTTSAGGSSASESSRHRLTFMVGFWTRNVPSGIKERRLYGPCGPLPPPTDEHTWVREIRRGYKETDSGENARFAVDLAAAKESMPMIYLKQISPAWERIPPIAAAANSSHRAEKNNIESDISSQPLRQLQIPRAIDHRFFVSGAPQCFRDSLFEDNYVDNRDQVHGDDDRGE